MGTIADKLTLLNTSKINFKEMLQYANSNITDETTFRDYVKGVFDAYINILNNPDDLFNALPKKAVAAGTSQSISGTIEAPMRITLKASELSQDATPTPDSPQDIHTISGDNSVVVCGKNLFNKDNISTNFSWNFNASAVLNSDKSVTITANSNNQVHYMVILPVYHYEVGKTYTISVKNNNSDGVGYLRMFYSSWQTQYENGSKTSITFTVQEGDQTDLGIGIYLNTNAVVTFYDFQIEEGSTATEYEPYVSQIAPINLPVENLFDINNEHKVVINPATGIERYGLRFKAPNKKVSVSGNWRSGLSLTYRLITNNVASNYVSILANTTISVIDEIVIYCGDDNVKMSSIVPNLQIEISDKPNSYTPYGTTPIEYCKIGNYEDEFILASGKNLFDIDTFKNLSTFNTYETHNNIECLKLVGRTITYNLNCKENTQYTFQFKYIDKTTADIGIFQFLYSDGTASDIRYSGQMTTSGTIYSATSTANKTITGIKWDAWNAGNSIYIDKNSMQLELGTSASSYEPYGTNQWYLKKNIGKVVLDGTENFTSAGTSGTDYRYNKTLSNLNIPNATTNNGLCISNYFQNVTIDTSKKWGAFYINGNWLVFYDSYIPHFLKGGYKFNSIVCEYFILVSKNMY